MSKLMEMMEARDTHKRAMYFEPLSSLAEIDESYLNTIYGSEYRIMVTLGAKVVVRDDSKDYLQEAVRQVKLNVVDAVFGEFKAPLREVQKLLWERKYEDAGKKLYSIEESMFRT